MGILTESLRTWCVGAGLAPDATREAFEATVRRALIHGVMTPEALVGHVMPHVLAQEPAERDAVFASVRDAIATARQLEEGRKAKAELLATYKEAFRTVEDCDFGPITEALRNWAWEHYELSSADAGKDSLVRRLALLAVKEGALSPEDYATLAFGPEVAPVAAPVIKQALAESQADGDEDALCAAVRQTVDNLLHS